MNELEGLLAKGIEEEISIYLGEVSVKEFIVHINEIKAKTADKEFIKMAITNLQSLIQ